MTRALILSCLGIMIVQAALAGEEPEELEDKAVEIVEILEDASAYEGQEVVIEGEIEDECPAGCWFTVNDGTATLYIDILPSNFVIPQERGSKARVYGEVKLRDGDPMMIGKIVSIDGEIFRPKE